MVIENLIASLRLLIPAGIAAVVTLLVVAGLHLLLGRWVRSRHRGQVRLAATLLVSVVGLLIVTVFLPIDDTLRAQVIGLGGVLIVALASTTLLGNAIAGVLLRVVGNFELGDWVRVEGQFGRVTERGLFHTEIATEDRDLTTLPNLYLVTKPVTVVRASGSIITADVSLGYDVGHERIKEILKKAAKSVSVGEPPEELQEVFVHVRELGDFSVVYRVGGLLKNVKLLLSARSRLRGAMLTALHEVDVEIVSPSFMNTRALASDKRFLPNSILEKLAVHRALADVREPETVLEEVATDKADEAEKAELRGDGSVALEADRVDEESRLQQAGVEVERESGEREDL
ncbi:MAG: mechanosensitive ion channel family protein [bacterium]|nr:mechanosensitive ion channel family protein [bacterium]